MNAVPRFSLRSLLFVVVLAPLIVYLAYVNLGLCILPFPLLLIGSVCLWVYFEYYAPGAPDDRKARAWIAVAFASLIAMALFALVAVVFFSKARE